MQEFKSAKMPKKNSLAAHRAWNVLRLALLWARKAGLSRNRLVVNWSVFGEAIRKLRHSSRQGRRGALVYGDRKFSFEDTPIIKVKMHRPSSMLFKPPHIPCMKPHVDLDYDFEYDIGVYLDTKEDELCCPRASFLKMDKEEAEEEHEYDDEDEEIDLKAEEFITKFYEQMKQQREKSYQQYRN